MKRKSHPRAKRTTTKSVLRLPDLEHEKAAVLNSLTSPDAQRGYRVLSTNSLTGIVPSLAWLSIVSWSFVIAHTADNRGDFHNEKRRAEGCLRWSSLL